VIGEDQNDANDRLRLYRRDRGSPIVEGVTDIAADNYLSEASRSALARNHDPVINGIGCVHTWSVA
jgi:hypothetical protein